MKIRKYSVMGTCLTVILFSLAGCSTNKPNTQNANHATNQAIKQAATAHSDGTIVSLTPIQVSNTSSVETYQMMYWSDNTKTEAFVAVPKTTGTVPLMVECHGGWEVAENVTHQNSYGAGAKALSGASSHEILLIPEYRGYGGSGGTVHGLYGDTLDSNNAIQAVMSKFSITPNHIYLEGTSMGGGVVLKLASERHDIRSVIANSPWVGMDINGAWGLAHRNGSQLGTDYYGYMLSYGTQNPNSPKLKRESIDYTKISAPVLLLQGTGDQNVPWQTVQTFYNDLKPYDNKVKLILFPGGQHGLQGKDQRQVYQDESNWYKHYGENVTTSKSWGY